MSSDERPYASDVIRGDFSYHPYRGLEVSRTQRCPSDRLYSLLTWEDTGPAFRKDGKPKVHQPPKHRDESHEFYSAQCVHYGLKPWKTREAAKKELLKAFGNKREISVPQQILDLEKDLKVGYAAANVLAKEEYEQEKRAEAEAERRRQLKRKRETEELLKEVGVVEAKKSKKSVLDLNKVAARYNVVAPYIRDMWGSSSDSYSLAIAPSPTGKEVYGEFDFGTFEGYLRSTSIDKTSRTIKFHWSGREAGEGESTFGEINVICITFLDDKTFEGYAEGDYFSRCDIAGRYDAEGSRNKVFQKSVSRWKDEYENLDEDNYERERGWTVALKAGKPFAGSRLSYSRSWAKADIKGVVHVPLE